ncbi:MAG: nuclear transport factor 2 family protein [Rubrivivax sp.]|nr:nuclear transport factor 2 family protein [Rubrivivax sp.]
MNAEDTVARVVAFYERLQPADLARLAQLYADGVYFKDPFNEVRGVAAVRRVFEHMFATLEAPRFIVHERVVQGTQAFLTWDFVFRLRGRSGEEIRVRGATHLRLAADGRVAEHRDYWDAAEELYEKLPVLGTLMRWLKRRVNA